MAPEEGRLRVALLAGGLTQGGAEKQLLYVVKVLRASGADVAVYSASRDGFYLEPLRALGVEPIWLGSFGGPVGRLARLVRMLATFRPHVIQATHAFMNLYAGLAGRVLGICSLGALRSSLRFCRRANGHWTPWLMSVAAGLITNSEAARNEVGARRYVAPENLFVLPNAIDVEDYPARAPSDGVATGDLVAVFVGRLIPSKRLDLFLKALARARGAGVPLRGAVIGDGPELHAGKALAAALGLSAEQCSFLGERADLPALLQEADMLVLCSDDEGLPNVVIEGMAAGLPVISTPAGDSASLVSPGVNGFLVPFGEVEPLSAAMAALAASPENRRDFGAAGRAFVRRQFSLSSLAERLFAIYGAMARARHDDETAALLPEAIGPRG